MVSAAHDLRQVRQQRPGRAAKILHDSARCGALGATPLTDVGLPFSAISVISSREKVLAMKVCPRCNGRGWIDDPNEECPDCNGTGQVENDEQEPAHMREPDGDD